MDDGGWRKSILYDSYVRTHRRVFVTLILVSGGWHQNQLNSIAVKGICDPQAPDAFKQSDEHVPIKALHFGALGSRSHNVDRG